MRRACKSNEAALLLETGINHGPLQILFQSLKLQFFWLALGWAGHGLDQARTISQCGRPMHRAWPQDPHPQCCAKCTMSDIPKELLEGGAAGWQLSPYSTVMPTVILESMADGEATTRESHRSGRCRWWHHCKSQGHQGDLSPGCRVGGPGVAVTLLLCFATCHPRYIGLGEAKLATKAFQEILATQPHQSICSHSSWSLAFFSHFPGEQLGRAW